jgi:hypothetical protein
MVKPLNNEYTLKNERHECQTAPVRYCWEGENKWRGGRRVNMVNVLYMLE